jgi:fructokinase
VAERAAQKEVQALASLERHAERLARGLAGVVNLLDPGVIVLGGGVGGIPGLAEGLAERIRPHVFSDDWRCEGVRPRFGDSSGVRGAAWLWDR